MIAASAERADDWISGGISWIASLIETLLKPQLRHSPIVTVIASAVSRREMGVGARASFCSVQGAVDYACVSSERQAPGQLGVLAMDQANQMTLRFRCPPRLEKILPRPIPAVLGLPDWFKACR